MAMTVLEQPASFTTLPREFYLEGPLFEAEMRRIWYRQWLYLAHASELPEPGGYVVRELLGESVLVVRGAGGEVSALLNVCRHRGARIVDASCGRLKRFVCPYHQWTYGLDGRLIGAPSMPDGEAVDYASLGLYRLPLETWGGFVFGYLCETPPPPLTREIEKLIPELARYAPERLRDAATRTYECDANWKVMLEDYLECYHCSASHPEFCATADLRIRAGDDYAEQSLHEQPYWSMDIPLREGAVSTSVTGARVSRVPLEGGDAFGTGRARTFGDWAAASVLYFYADYAMVHAIRPVSATHTQCHLTWFLHEDAEDGDVDLAELERAWDSTTRQDATLVERAQSGLGSRRYSPGPLSAKHEPYLRSSLNIYRAIMEGDEAVAQLLQVAADRRV
jgi:phenylpropionate dioxygenase-like ring-hydroxylating dioxygenase large terminal subunit